MTACPERGAFVEARIDRVLTQYRESPKLLYLLRTYLGAVYDVHSLVCDLPEAFDLDSAVGDQLTLLGKRLGWPRTHCVCDVQPTFGFNCEGYSGEVPVSGFCDGNATWLGCISNGLGVVSIDSDDLYRRFLKVRRFQIRKLYDRDSLVEAIRLLWGDTASILDAGHGRVVVAPGRDLTDGEIALLQLYPRVLPLALGVSVRFHFGSSNVFGFGTGWGGFCNVIVPEELLLGEDGEPLSGEDTEPLLSEPVWSTETLSEWMCEFDVRPYSC